MMKEWDLQTGPRGLRLRVCEWGTPEDGRLPIIILHGFLEQGAVWDSVASHLPGRVVAPDMRGHGLSGHIGPGGFYHFWDYVPDVATLIDHLGGRVDLVGHSMGGGLAMLLCALRPEKVRRLVNIEGLGPLDAEGRDLDQADKFVAAIREPPRHRLIRDIEEGVKRMRRWNPHLSPRFARFLVERITRPPEPGDDYQGTPTEGALIWTWDPLHRARSPVPFRALSFQQFLERVKVPVLFIRGADSPFVLPDQAEREALIQDLRTSEVHGAGHMIHHQKPRELAALIAEHLA
ncbi:MAG: alpha/beta hydrolase [Deltaproteobacteria bacterium]|nr:alpha/beta hydrolase [Deltaproteobacteria bacterium]